MTRLRIASRIDYLHSLLLPEEARETALVLRSYHLELLEVVRRATEPSLAAIRLQWWADGVRGEREGELRSHPVGDALAEFVNARPHAREALAVKAEAHADGLQVDKVRNREAFEQHAGETRSIVLQLIAAETGTASGWTEACGHAGVAELAADCLRALPQLIQSGSPPNPFDLDTKSAPAQFAETLGAFGVDHAQRAVDAIPSGAARSLLARSAVDRLICRQAVQQPDRVAAKGAEIGPLRAQWAMWRF